MKIVYAPITDFKGTVGSITSTIIGKVNISDLGIASNVAVFTLTLQKFFLGHKTFYCGTSLR